MDLLGLDTYAPFVAQDRPESSLYIEYDKTAYEGGAPQWPTQFVRLPRTALRSHHRSRSCASPHLLHTHCTLPLTQLRRRDHVEQASSGLALACAAFHVSVLCRAGEDV